MALTPKEESQIEDMLALEYDAFLGTSNATRFYKKPITKTTKTGRKIKVYGEMDYLLKPCSKEKQ